jgi:N-acetylglucosamine-6-phosphate deacetylase
LGMRYLHAQTIFTGEEWLVDHVVICDDVRIVSVLPLSEVSNATIEACGDILAPAFIDLQIYGAYKKLLAVFPVPDTLALTYEYCLSGGATLFLPTLATNTSEVFRLGIDAVRAYWEQGGKGVHGLHLEGPWMNPVRRGAHVESLIHPPTEEEVNELLEYGDGVIKMITLAPEVCSEKIIRKLSDAGIILSAGHSNVTYEEAMAGFRNGITTVTHLYNAMSPLHHREPGLVGAAFSDSKAFASIIPDGHHVDFAAVRIAKMIMKDRLFAITDAVTETSEGHYRHEDAGDKYECNGVLSGSALTMHDCFVNLVKKAGIDAGEALRMCSLYPARVARLDRLYGKIAPGYQAQFVTMNKQLEMLSVIT